MEELAAIPIKAFGGSHSFITAAEYLLENR